MNNAPHDSSSELTLSPVIGRARDWPAGHAMDLVRKGAVDELRSAIIRGCPVDEPDAQQHTALHLAARHGHLPCVELLLAAGLRPDLTDSSGFTPAELADQEGHSECATRLRRAQTELHGVDETN